MRLDGFAPSYPSADRAPQRGVVVPYRESQRAVEQARPSRETAADRARETAAGRARPAYEQWAQQQPGEAATAESPGARPIELMPARFEALFERPLSTRVSQALASYQMTAAISIDFDAPEIVGLDLYA